MPHIILTHNNTIHDDTINYETLFKHLSTTLASDNFCDSHAIKCYHTIPQNTYLPTSEFFVHVELKLLDRELPHIQEKAVKLREIIKQAFPKSYADNPHAFSFEVRLMNKDLYMKGTQF